MRDENAWAVPGDVWAGLHPRRGGRPLPEDALPLTSWGSLDRVLDRDVIYDEKLLAAGRRYLEEPDGDPVAAAVGALLTGGGSGMWATVGGVGFAARVVGETFRLAESGALWTVPVTGGETYERLWRGEDFERAYAVARAVRRLLATAPEADHERAGEILAGFREWPSGRIITSYLMPTRVDWVDEDCAAAAGWRSDRPEGRDEWAWADHRRLSGVLLLSAGRTEHLDLLRGSIVHAMLGYRDVGVVATVLDGVGPAAAAMLADPFFLQLLHLQDDTYRNQDRPGPAMTRVLAGTPDDDAMRVLLRDTLDDRPCSPGRLLRSGALARYPLRALRMLAERDDPVSRDLFGGLVLSEPRLIPQLPEPLRSRAAQVGPGIGTGWAALLDSADDTHRSIDSADDTHRPIDSADDVKRAVAALAAIPTEEAFALLLDRVDRKHFRPALLSAAKRDPRLAMRVLAAHAGRGGTVTELLRDHALAYPAAAAEVLAAHPELSALLRSAEPVTGATPPVLAVALDRAPALPEWLVVARLPQVTLRLPWAAGPTGGTTPSTAGVAAGSGGAVGGAALSVDAVRRLCELVVLSRLDQPRPEIAEVRAVCEPAGLSALAAEVFAQWQAAGSPSKNNFAMVAMALLGDDTNVPAFSALLPTWSSTPMRVKTGMAVLAAIGTDLALTHLHRFGRRARTAGFRRLAAERIGSVAEARGLRPEQLADRIVPDAGLDADGRAVLDYGPRRFTLGFDEQLRPWVAGPDGKRLARLPRPGRGDDPELAPAAYRRFAEIKKEVKDVAKERIRSVERAMISGRRWTASEFRAFYLRHPLMWQITHRLLWATFDERDSVVTAFRVAEDRSLADIHDRTWELPADATVGVPHPWHVAADRGAWSELFADYAVLQPFPQLGRELTAAGGVDLTSFAGLPVTSSRLWTLVAGMWERGPDQSSIVRNGCMVRYSPGFHWQEPNQDEQHLTAVIGADDLSPIEFSEVVRDLRYLTAAG